METKQNIIKIDSMELKLDAKTMDLLKLPRDEFIAINRGYLDSIGQKYYSPKNHSKKINPSECPLHAWTVFNHISCTKQSDLVICPLCGNLMCSKCNTHEIKNPFNIKCLPLRS